MHVGLVVYGDLTATTGGFRYDRRLAGALRAAGHRVTVVSLPWRDYPRALADNLDPRVRRKLRGRRGSDRRGRREGFDLLLQDELCHPSLVGHNRAIETPIVTVVHHLRASERWPAWQKPVYRTIERRYLESTDAAVYASEATRRAAERLAGPRPSAVARPAGDRFDPGLTDGEIAARAERDPLRICFVGSLVPRKGLDVLLDGLARVDGDWRLSVVGNATDEEYAERVREQARDLGVADRTRFEGRLSDGALADRLAASHLLAVPSRFEGYGIVYLEGMGFGLPALASSAGGATELVTDGEDGFLIPPGSSEAVAAAVRTLRDDRATLREMALAARRRFERHPGWDESMATARQFLERVAAGSEAAATEVAP
ncbi:glycosyltransferase family 4 protein [Halorussus gelatinilyticus]|uniref:Glycosyltransferase family 4 protein n=1 Tax=Halorussus gelatinilyticus TaxID=2937524 RepID=A0A8U0IDS6_9EURY|nr:glycosyltransferase family 4 protein [Halorussus gelatinilyticus]UPV98875.1 glycosyltransferase family 4 protein [Halorussus gelatinilyticus]